MRRARCSSSRPSHRVRLLTYTFHSSLSLLLVVAAGPPPSPSFARCCKFQIRCPPAAAAAAYCCCSTADALPPLVPSPLAHHHAGPWNDHRSHRCCYCCHPRVDDRWFRLRSAAGSRCSSDALLSHLHAASTIGSVVLVRPSLLPPALASVSSRPC